MIAATAARCGESLHAAEVALERARALALAGGGDELIALELRDALDHLGRIVGKVYADDILDRIFSRFCIGK
jgi:tRNA modification GTPase